MSATLKLCCQSQIVLLDSNRVILFNCACALGAAEYDQAITYELLVIVGACMGVLHKVPAQKIKLGWVLVV